MPVTGAQRVNNRVKPLLDAAAGQFATKGYRAATIRDIAAAVEISTWVVKVRSRVTQRRSFVMVWMELMFPSLLFRDAIM